MPSWRLRFLFSKAANIPAESGGSSDYNPGPRCHVALSSSLLLHVVLRPLSCAFPPLFFFPSFLLQNFSGVCPRREARREMRTARPMGWAMEADATAGLAVAIAGNGLRWWNEINESDEWQRWLYYTLCGCYCFTSLVALVQIIRIQFRVPEFGWTTQKLFHLMNFIVNGLRAVLFGYYQNVFVLKPKVLEIALFDLPSLLFFSTYTLLVLFWAEIYHQARSQPVNKLRPTYIIINGIVYVIQICIWVYMQASPRSIAGDMAKLFLSVLSLFAALGFLIYGGRLFLMLRRFPIESKGRRKKLNEVGYVTGICSTCFLIRCIMVAVSECDKDADIDVLDHPILNFVYYMLVEILPSALVLFILRKLPPKRASNHYHPIH